MNFFDSDQTFAQAKEGALTPKNLTPGTYKLLITQVEVGKHVKGSDFIPSTDAAFMGDDIEFRFHCCTTDKVGDFPAGWKYTFFFQTKTKNADGTRSVQAKIALGDMQRITEACGMNDWPKDPQEWQGKQFVATFSYGYAKNDVNKEKPFLNLTKVEPATDWANGAASAPATAPAVQASTASVAAQPMPLGSTMASATNASTPNWD